MVSVEVDTKNNELHVTLSDVFNEMDALECRALVTQAMNDLEPGFAIVTDLIHLHELEPDAMPHIRKMMDVCNRHGVSRVIRVLPDPLQNFGLTVTSYFHYERDVSVLTCESLEEAAHHLARN